MPASLLRNIFLCAVLLTAFSSVLKAEDTPEIKRLRKESAEMKKRIAENEVLLRNTKKNVSAQINALSLLGAQITSQQELIAAIQAEADTLQMEMKVLEGELTSLNKELDICKRKYRNVVLYMNRNRLTQNRWSYILTSKNYRQMYRRLRFAENYSDFLRIQGEAIKKKEAKVQAKKAELLVAKKEKDALLKEAREQQIALEGQKQKQQEIVTELNKKQTQLQTTLKQQRRKQSQLNNKIDKLIQEEIAKAEAARRAAEARKKKEEEERRRAEANRNNKKNSKKSTKKSDKKATPRYEEADEKDRTLAKDFQANRGRLPIPITGSYAITGRYGTYNVENLKGVMLDNKGLNITGKSGAKARSVFKGTVTTVANLSGLYIVIIRHGNYFSVYSNLSSVSVKNGQSVSTRQAIGNVAKDSDGNYTLHFQLRKHSGKTAAHIDPYPWLAK